MADRLTHIYTKTGDNGETSLGNGQRVKKIQSGWSALDQLMN